MSSFVRKNLLTISGQFLTAPTGPCGCGPNSQNWGDSNQWWGSPGCTGSGQSPAFQGTAAVNGNVATVFSVGFGVLAPGNLFTMPGIPTGTMIVSQTTGAQGGTGTYVLSNGGLSVPQGQVVGYFAPAPTPEPAVVTCTLAYYAPVLALPPCPPGSPPNSWPFGAPGYCPPAPVQLKQTISLALQSDGLTWLGTWDSSVAEGRVDWIVNSSGTVQAAAQGTFFVQANSANVQVP